jgi:hypothetical protein
MLAPSSFVPISPQDFALMIALRTPMERIEKLIVDLERTSRDPTAQRPEKSEGIFVAMQHLSDLVVDVSKEFEARTSSSRASARPARSCGATCRRGCWLTSRTCRC